MNIHDFYNKIKGWGNTDKKTLTFYIILTISCTVSFYLGYLAKSEAKASSPVVINCPVESYKAQNKPLSQVYKGNATLSSYEYIASKNGKNYYPLDCQAGSRIKPENIIKFSTKDEAELAGYTLAKTCQNQ